ncbi:hypothetical protein JCM19379_28990 [Methyloparacoccus murrellii]
MNPLDFKAHPLLHRWIDFVLAPGAHSVTEGLLLLAILLGSNLLWAAGLPWLLRKAENLELTPVQTYLYTLPATLLYAPLMLTLMQDVIAHAFELRHRWFLLFALLAVSQILTAFYAFALRQDRGAAPIGLESGLAVSLFLLLVSIPASLLLMGLHALHPFF